MTDEELVSETLAVCRAHHPRLDWSRFGSTLLCVGDLPSRKTCVTVYPPHEGGSAGVSLLGLEIGKKRRFKDNEEALGGLVEVVDERIGKLERDLDRLRELRRYLGKGGKDG